MVLSSRFSVLNEVKLDILCTLFYLFGNLGRLKDSDAVKLI